MPSPLFAITFITKQVFHEIVGILMGTNYTPLITNIFTLLCIPIYRLVSPS